MRNGLIWRCFYSTLVCSSFISWFSLYASTINRNSSSVPIPNWLFLVRIALLCFLGSDKKVIEVHFWVLQMFIAIVNNFYIFVFLTRRSSTKNAKHAAMFAETLFITKHDLHLTVNITLIFIHGFQIQNTVLGLLPLSWFSINTTYLSPSLGISCWKFPNLCQHSISCGTAAYNANVNHNHYVL